MTCSHDGLRIHGGAPRQVVCNDCGETIDVESSEVRALVTRWDDPQPPFDGAAALVEAMARMLEPPRPSVCLMPSSFYFAWCRRWSAHRLSRALGYPSKEPPIRQPAP